jgi:hypothetical protein
LFDGDLSIAQPTDLVDIVTIDGSCLTFGTEAGEVFKAVGMLKAGNRNWNISLNGESPIQYFMVPADEKNIVISDLRFARKSGMLGKWVNCNKNLREINENLSVMLFDNCWLPNYNYDEAPEDTIKPMEGEKKK